MPSKFVLVVLAVPVVKKMFKKLCALRRGYFVLVTMVFSTVTSDASSVIYQFEPVSTGPFPGGQTREIKATFEDKNPGTVLLTITSSDLGRGEFLSDLYFNFDPADNIKRLHFAGLPCPHGWAFSKISTGVNSFKADGGYYDVHFDFSKNGKETFSGNDSETYLIMGAGLDASDFAFVDSPGSCAGASGSYYAMAHIQGFCGKGEWLGCHSLQPVPEPASLAFHAFAAGLGWCILARVNRTRRTRSLC
jgi:hypothetical protein